MIVQLHVDQQNVERRSFITEPCLQCIIAITTIFILHLSNII